MKTILLITGICIFISCQRQHDDHLFPFEEKNRIGFINNKGEVIIKPIFRSAGNFSEGLIAARVNGLYGYVDKTGQFVIPPRFEYASDFNEGFAIIAENNIPSYINKKGEKPFETTYATLNPFKNGRAMVGTKSHKIGVIDRNGNLLIDTLYNYIDTIGFGLSEVQTIDINEGHAKIGIIDTLGNFVVPLGKYDLINEFVEGYAKVETHSINEDLSSEGSKTGFIDTKGNLIFETTDSKTEGWDIEDMHDGIAQIKRNIYQKSEEDSAFYPTGNIYKGFINIKGEVILNDTLIDELTDFSNKRAFIKMANEDDYSLVDTQLKSVANKKFHKVFNNGFDKGYAFVTVGAKDEYGLINTSGEFIFEPQFEEIHYIGILENYFFYGIHSPTKENQYRTLYGVADVTGKIWIKPVFEKFDYNGFNHGLLEVIIDQKVSYIDKKGKIVWQEKQDSLVEDFNIDYMKRGYFYAGAEPEKKEPGGFGGSDNAPQTINNPEDFAKNELSVVIKTNQPCVIIGKWNGYKVYIANTTKGDIQFKAQDSRLYMKLQAKDSNGLWKDIEYLPSSWCGNSYHALTLKKQNFWAFSVPKYQGDIPTKARVELTYLDPGEKVGYYRAKKTITTYSNEFEVSVNPGQFWRKQDYFPSNIMDPYLD